MTRPEYRARNLSRDDRHLAQLHNVDVEAAGLSEFGKPGNYFGRQVDRWTKQYRCPRPS
jgi:aminoglycoside phosphotransferase (APT) family kinase protein